MGASHCGSRKVTLERYFGPKLNELSNDDLAHELILLGDHRDAQIRDNKSKILGFERKEKYEFLKNFCQKKENEDLNNIISDLKKKYLDGINLDLEKKYGVITQNYSGINWDEVGRDFSMFPGGF